MASKTAEATGSGSKEDQAKQLLAELLAIANRRGFYGDVSLSAIVQDGHIQHLKISTERMIR